MKPVNQLYVSSTRGDCTRATIASIFELELEQVPHFRLYQDSNWFLVYYYFIYSLGYEYMGQHHPEKSKLEFEDSINGYFDACVPSKTFKGGSHSVVIDTNGVVVHDPNPNKLYQGENVLESGVLEFWYCFKKVKK